MVFNMEKSKIEEWIKKSEGWRVRSETYSASLEKVELYLSIASLAACDLIASMCPSLLCASMELFRCFWTSEFLILLSRYSWIASVRTSEISRFEAFANLTKLSQVTLLRSASIWTSLITKNKTLDLKLIKWTGRLKSERWNIWKHGKVKWWRNFSIYKLRSCKIYRNQFSFSLTTHFKESWTTKNI